MGAPLAQQARLLLEYVSNQKHCLRLSAIARFSRSFPLPILGLANGDPRRFRLHIDTFSMSGLVRYGSSDDEENGQAKPEELSGAAVQTTLPESQQASLTGQT